MQITVKLGPRSYPVFLEDNAHASFANHLKELFPKSRFALVTNTTIAGLYQEIISKWEEELSLVKFVLPDGEKYKTLEIWSSVLDFLLKSALDRKSVVCALGGGVVGDIVGFASAAFLRGVACVQIPTTLLAMVDSSVGGKTGVNHALGKNLIGAFHQPSLVWMDASFLDTLPDKQFVAGYAELFKYAFIGGKDMFEFVSARHDKMIARERLSLLEGMQRSVEIKAAIVESDEKEMSGRRALLNFGHTFAHAIERLFNFDRVLHGEAVFIGMKCACDLGARIGTIPPSAVHSYTALLARLPAIALPSQPDADSIYNAMFTDKKMAAGKLTFVLPKQPGTSVLMTEVPEKAVLETLRAVTG
jgi:3-dehydroquinate synthase